MLPFIPIKSRRPQDYKADLSAPTPSPDSAMGAMAFSMSFGYSELSSPASLPPPPPPSPNDMLDITPRKCSFSNTIRMNNACAFPSWPKGSSLLGGESTTSSYLSDEDLYVPESAVIVDEESAAHDPMLEGASMTTEQQVQLIRAAAEEEECRARFMAQVQAHARAHQALRINQHAAMEREMTRRKQPRRIRTDKKRRIAFASTSKGGSGSDR